jgi:hypothetical protein
MAQIAAASEMEAERIIILPSGGYSPVIDGFSDKKHMADRMPPDAGWRKTGAAPRSIETGSHQG